jgi:DNA-binding NtrC family response regulator
MSNTTVVVVDDDANMCALVRDMMRPRGIPVVIGELKSDIVSELDKASAAVFLTDLRLPRIDGLELCRRVVAARPDVPVVVMTGFGSLETAIDAIRAGAYDFVTKPVDAASLAVVLERAIKHHQLKSEVRLLRQQAADRRDVDAIIGESQSMREVRDVIKQVAPLDVTVLISGESGTGKEVVARALHDASPRRDAPFVAINCAAMPEQLLESQMFGHVRGAFTDARSDRNGLLVQASGGTLFLDEIGELPLVLQPKLLRALQERVVRPVGADKEVPFDARIVVATNKDLQAAAQAGTFREDLFYRVNVVHIALPPLRARGEDVLRLAQLFLTRAAQRMNRPVRGISAGAAAALLAHPWPGNVRELQNAIERAVALTRYEDIVASDLPARAMRNGPSISDEIELISLDEVERRHTLAVLQAVKGSRKKASAILGVDPKTLYRKLVAWGADANVNVAT